VVIALAVLVALTRLLALSKSIWDWDEGLFCLALRDYNVVFHHPHPPGFPLFIAAAKLVRLIVHDDFHALRAVSLIASMFVFPALYAFGRALRFPFRTSVIAALLFSFLPNVWFWGGTAFSDVFAMVLFLAGGALLLECGRPRPHPPDVSSGGDARSGETPDRCGRDARTPYFLGSILFAGTLLVRPQNVLLAYPWFLASWRRVRAHRLRDVVVSAALITVLVLAGYGLAARATGGWDVYIKATVTHQRYVATVDGGLNPNRPAPSKVLLDFAVDPFQAGRVSYALGIFAALAFLRPRRRDFDVLITFVPNFLLAWLMLSVTGVSRLSLGYIPMHALLAADGIALIAAFLARRREQMARAVEAALAAILIGAYIVWVWPALREVRKHDSPPVAAARWIQEHVSRATGRVYVQGGVVPFADYFLSGYNTEGVPDEFDPTTAPEEPGAVYFADRMFDSPHALNFVRPRRHLFALFHHRYFETCVVPVTGGPRAAPGKVEFVDGWYAQEADERGRPFRWMGGRSRLLLQALPQTAELTLQFYAPIDAEPPPNISIVFNSKEIDRFHVAQATFARTYNLDCRTAAPCELVISVDGVVNPARLIKGADARDLGLRVGGVTWQMLKR
jgi:hypothetical protein